MYSFGPQASFCVFFVSYACQDTEFDCDLAAVGLPMLRTSNLQRNCVKTFIESSQLDDHLSMRPEFDTVPRSKATTGRQCLCPQRFHKCTGRKPGTINGMVEIGRCWKKMHQHSLLLTATRLAGAEFTHLRSHLGSLRTAVTAAMITPEDTRPRTWVLSCWRIAEVCRTRKDGF